MPADERQLKNADLVFMMFCEVLDDRHWKYEKDEKNRLICYSVRGKDLPMPFAVAIDPERQLVRVVSRLPFTFSEDKRLEGALATCHANLWLVDGCFDYSFRDGVVHYKNTATFCGSLLSKELLTYLVEVGCATVDAYNDKFLMIEKGELSIDEFRKNR